MKVQHTPCAHPVRLLPCMLRMYLTGLGWCMHARPCLLLLQVCPYGLYAEQLSGTPFTVPRK